MMPWKLYSDAAAYIFTWLIGYSSLMGALGGILIARLLGPPAAAARSCDDLFRSAGRYTRIANGINWRAIVALVLAILPVVPGLHPRRRDARAAQVADPNFFDTLYTYAWFVTFALSFVSYLAD